MNECLSTPQHKHGGGGGGGVAEDENRPWPRNNSKENV